MNRRSSLSRRQVLISGSCGLAVASCARTGDLNTFDQAGDEAILVAGFKPLDAASAGYDVSVGLINVDPDTLRNPGNLTALFSGTRSYFAYQPSKAPSNPYVWDQGPAGTYVINSVWVEDRQPAYITYRRYSYRYGDIASNPDLKKINLRVDTLKGSANYIGDFAYKIIPSTSRSPLRIAIVGVTSTYESARTAFPNMNSAGIPLLSNLMKPIA